MSPVCVLVGPPGAGKSTVGQLLAVSWKVDFRDTDDDVVTLAGMSIPDIFFDRGEEHFRLLEREAVSRALAEHRGVLALGGGAVLAAETRAALLRHLVVYLDADLATAVSRVKLGAGRPFLKVQPRATLKHLLDQRRPWYEEVADVVVSATGSPAEVAETVRVAVADWNAEFGVEEREPR